MICPIHGDKFKGSGTSLAFPSRTGCRRRAGRAAALASMEGLVYVRAAAERPAPSPRDRDGHPPAAAVDISPAAADHGEMSRRTCLVRSGWVGLGRMGSDWSRLLGSARSGLLGSEMLGSGRSARPTCAWRRSPLAGEELGSSPSAPPDDPAGEGRAGELDSNRARARHALRACAPAPFLCLSPTLPDPAPPATGRQGEAPYNTSPGLQPRQFERRRRR